MDVACFREATKEALFVEQVRVRFEKILYRGLIFKKTHPEEGKMLFPACQSLILW